MKIYVANLEYGLQDEDLKNMFAEFGEVSSAVIIKDKFTGRGKGFGFVEMPNDEEAVIAIKSLDGKNVNDREIKVSEARPPEERKDFKRSGGGGNKFGGGGGGDRRGGGGGGNRFGGGGGDRRGGGGSGNRFGGGGGDRRSGGGDRRDKGFDRDQD